MTGTMEWAVGNPRSESPEDAHQVSAGHSSSTAVPERWKGAVTVTATPEAPAARQHDPAGMVAAEPAACSAFSLESLFTSAVQPQEHTRPAASRPGALKLTTSHVQRTDKALTYHTAPSMDSCYDNALALLREGYVCALTWIPREVAEAFAVSGRVNAKRRHCERRLAGAADERRCCGVQVPNLYDISTDNTSSAARRS